MRLTLTKYRYKKVRSTRYRHKHSHAAEVFFEELETITEKKADSVILLLIYFPHSGT